MDSRYDYNSQMNNLQIDDNYLDEDPKQDYNSNYNPSQRIGNDSTKISYKSPTLHYNYKPSNTGSTSGKFIDNNNQSTGFSTSTNRAKSKNKTFISNNNYSSNNIYTSSNTNARTPKTPKSLTNMKSFLSKNMSETGSSFTFQENVKNLETMINEIKSYGFDRIKTEIDDKLIYKKNLENNVNSLENSLKIIKNHSKHNGTSNIKLVKENDRLLFTGDVRLINLFIF
jgi:hypothetical protein